MAKNQLLLHNGPMGLPEITDDCDSKTLFIVFTDLDRKILTGGFPEARVFSACYQKDHKNADWSEFNKQHAQVTGLESWDEEDPEILEAQTAVVIESKTVVRSPKGQKAVEALVEYLDTFVGSVIVKKVANGKPLSKILKDDPEGDYLYSHASELAESGYEGRVRAEMGDDPIEIINSISQAVEHNAKEELFELPGGQLGSIIYDGGKEDFRMHPYSVEAMTIELAQWVEYRNKDHAVTTLPKQYVTGYMDRGYFPGVAPLESLAPAPVLGKSLVPRFDTGYDADTKTYVTKPVDDLGAFTEEVTEKDAQEAATRLLEWFENVAFEYESSKADALAFALTPLLMRYMPNTPVPGLLFSADSPNSGKTTAAQMVSLMGGEPAKIYPLPRATEAKTMITTILNSSTKVCIFDNVKTAMDSDVLESLLTKRDWSDRKYHTQNDTTVKNNTVWCFTKNTPEVSEDMLRRLVIIPMSKKANPEMVWDVRTLDKLSEARSAVLLDLLTLIMFWKAEGENWGSARYEGFDQWAGVLSGILEGAGVSGFLDSREESKQKVDTGSGDKAEMLLRIARVMGDHERWTLTDLQNTVELGELDRLDNDDLTKDKKIIARHLNKGTGSTRSIGRLLTGLVGDDISPVVKLVQTEGRARQKYYQIKITGKLNLADLADLAED